MKETILVVDDEKEIADLLELYIGGEGYSVVKAYTGAEALETLRRQPVSLALNSAEGSGRNLFFPLSCLRQELPI